MRYKTLSLALAAIALLAFSAARAADKAADEKSHDGTVVSAGDGKLVMADKDKKEHSHAVGPHAKITIDGKEAKLEDLKKGNKITVTTDKDGKVLAIAAVLKQEKL